MPNSIIDLTETNFEQKLDPFIELSLERVNIFLHYLTIYYFYYLY